MATAAIPLAFESAQILIPLIKSLIGHIHSNTNPKPAASTVQATVTSAVQPVVSLLNQTGVLPSGVDPNALSGMIQTLISEMSTPVPDNPPPVQAPSSLPVVISGQDAASIGPTSIFPPGTKFVLSGTITLT